jgi:hypothetical protein
VENVKFPFQWKTYLLAYFDSTMECMIEMFWASNVTQRILSLLGCEKLFKNGKDFCESLLKTPKASQKRFFASIKLNESIAGLLVWCLVAVNNKQQRRRRSFGTWHIKFTINWQNILQPTLTSRELLISHLMEIFQFHREIIYTK